MSVCVYVGHGYKNLTGPTLTILSVSGLFSSHHLSCCASSMKRKGHSIPQWSQILAFRWRTRTDGAWFTHNSFLAFAARRIIVQQCPAHSHPHTFYWERQWVESEKRACLRSVLAELGCGCRWLPLRLFSLTCVERKLIAKHFFTNVSFTLFPCLIWMYLHSMRGYDSDKRWRGLSRTLRGHYVSGGSSMRCIIFILCTPPWIYSGIIWNC